MTDSSMRNKIEAWLGDVWNERSSEAFSPKDDKNNAKVLAEVFFWQTVSKFAEKREKELWKRMEEDEIIDTGLYTVTGEHKPAASRFFEVVVKVSHPVKRFDLETFAKKLHSKFKVPKAFTSEAHEAAKIPTKGTVTKSVVEI
jgi:hypothetical protein